MTPEIIIALKYLGIMWGISVILNLILYGIHSIQGYYFYDPVGAAIMHFAPCSSTIAVFIGYGFLLKDIINGEF